MRVGPGARRRRLQADKQPQPQPSSWQKKLLLALGALCVVLLVTIPYIVVENARTRRLSLRRQVLQSRQSHYRDGLARYGQDYDDFWRVSSYYDEVYREARTATELGELGALYNKGTPTETPDPGAKTWIQRHQTLSKSAKKLQYPLFWWAPFWTSTGYGQEALQYVESLLEYGVVQPQDLWIKQSGDTRTPGYLDKLPQTTRDVLRFHEYAKLVQTLPASEAKRSPIIMCHSFPDCWFKEGEYDFLGHEGCPCPDYGMAGQYAYKIGRTMFETHNLPSHLAAHVQAFDEVWVPSEFTRESFERSGVDRDKIRVLPESINTTLFDPARYPSPYPLLKHSTLVLGQPAKAAADAAKPSTSSARRRLLSSQGSQQEGHAVGGSTVHHTSRKAFAGSHRTQHSHAGHAPAAHHGKHAGSHTQHADGGKHAGSHAQHAAGSKHAGSHSQHAAGAKQVGPARLAGHQKRRQQLHDQAGDVHGSASASRAPSHRVTKPWLFMSVFKWESRKGWDLLLKAYVEEFAGQDDVDLVLVTHPFMEEVKDWKAKVREGVRGKINPDLTDQEMDTFPRVHVMDAFLSQDDFPGIYKAADVLVQPTRGEGWGRPEMEAMSMGLPVIATNWSGLTAFVNDQVAYPLKIDGIVDTEPDGPNFFMYFRDQKWAQPSVRHLRQLLRHTYLHRREARARGIAARQHVLDHFSNEVVARQVRALLDDVEKRLVIAGVPATLKY